MYDYLEILDIYAYDVDRAHMEMEKLRREKQRKEEQKWTTEPSS